VTGAPGNGNANGNANVGGNDDPSSGTRLGDFTLLKRLGRGAQGEVYEAREESLGRLVALKVLPPYLTFNPERVQRFKREAEAGGRLDHPNTVGVHSVGEASGYHYIAQELVAGGRTVADRIAEVRREAELPRDWYEKTAALFVDVAEAVHAAHEAGIVHRDIKPGNILLTHDGQPKVADFGLAMVLDDLHRSRSGELIGTPFYMSPEQAAGGRAGLDRRTDVFSLGTTLYESLTLLRPFDGETREQVVERILLHDPPDPRKVRPSVPRELAIICMKALEKKRERRYQTAAGFADDVRRWLRHEPIVARPPGAVVRAGKWLQRHPVSTGFAAAFVLVVALLIKANSAEDLADAERRKAEANDQKRQTFLSSLLSDVFEPSKFDLDQPRPMPSATDPYLAKVGDLEKLAARLGPAAGLPEERCHLLTVAGMAYANYSLFDDSNRCLVAALDQARALDPSDPENAEIVAHAALELGRLRRWTHDWPEARSLLSEARALFAERRGEASEQVCAATLPLADVLYLSGRPADAESLLRSSIASWADGPAGAAEPLLLQRKLGNLVLDAGRLDEARELLQPAFENARPIFPEATHAEFEAMLALLYDRLGRAAAGQQSGSAPDLDARAEKLFEESIERLRAARPEPSEQVAQALSNYGSFLSARKRFAEARPVLEGARDAALRSVGPDHFVSLQALNNLATLCFREGRKDEAEAILMEVVASDRRAPPLDPRPNLMALKNLAKLCYEQVRFPEATAWADELVARTPSYDLDYTDRCQLRDKIAAAASGAPVLSPK